MPMVNLIRKCAVLFTLATVILQTCLRVIGFDEHKFARDTGEWVYRYSRILNNKDSTGSSFINVHSMHSPHLDIVDLMDWEEECIKEGALLLRSNETARSKNRQQDTKCNPPTELVADCCEGSYSSAGTVLNVALGKCSQSFQSSAHHNSSLQKHARTFLEEMPIPSRGDDKLEGNNIHCDVCQIVELGRQHNLTVTFLGDSMQAQVWQGLIYELQRRNYTTRMVSNSTQREGFWKTHIQYRETLEVQSWDTAMPPVIMKFFQLYILPFQYTEEMAEVVDSGDVLVLGFGLHWNSNMPEYPMSVPSAYVASMRDLLSYIRVNGTRTQLLVHRETSAQHFDSPAGDFTLWMRTPNKTQHCKPITAFHPELSSWRETCVKDAASQAGYRYLLAGSNMPRRKTPPEKVSRQNTSREQVRSTSTTPELLVLPYYNFTAPHYDQHPPEKIADCTHYCPSPFLYLPLWRSFRIVMDRQYSDDPSLTT